MSEDFLRESVWPRRPRPLHGALFRRRLRSASGRRDQKDMALREFAVVHPLVVAGRGSVYFDNTTSGGVAAALVEIKACYGGNVVEFRSCSWLPPGNAICQP